VKLGTPRLLPIVIAATAALLLFKGIGIVTEGGYALIGTNPVVAAEGAKPAEGSSTAVELTNMNNSNMTDQSPTLEDKSVTMALPSTDPAAATPAAPAHGAETPAVGPADAAVPTEPCPVTPDPAAAAAPADGTAAPAADASHGNAVTGPIDPCKPDPGVNQYGDALPLVKDNATGQLVPLADVTADTSSEGAINDRLSQRRADLDKQAKELDMRAALLDAAEKRIDERSAELKALEDKINKLVDDNKTAEQQQFVSLVAMYENMKPKDAAAIFNQLDMPVLLGVAKAMNPRKMSPILAKMDPLKAKALTDNIAASDTPVDPTAAAGATTPDLTNLPQIVGQ
jgi:flagellar motility protein MotE (MotC chaperone)